jgi:NACHT domain
VLEEAFFATQPLSPDDGPQDQTTLHLTRSISSPVSSHSDYPDEAMQPPLKAVQHTNHSPEPMLSASPQSAMHHLPTTKLPAHQQVSAGQNQNRVRMIRRLRRSYSDLMSQSLQGAAWLELEIASKPDAVQNAANLLLRMERSTEELLPAGTSITQAYDEAGHELLILGEPGAGKSTLLLNLAQQLLVRAETDETHPLPVILPLSSWAVKRLPLQEWIAEQLGEIYNVPRKLSEQWLQEDGILPLLDGLDEMEETARSACVAAINTYKRDHLTELVVSSRTTEYKAAASCHRLALQGAAIVQPLTHEEVHAYLIEAGEPLTTLRRTLRENRTLLDLATIPR